MKVEYGINVTTHTNKFRKSGNVFPFQTLSFLCFCTGYLKRKNIEVANMNSMFGDLVLIFHTI